MSASSKSIPANLIIQFIDVYGKVGDKKTALVLDSCSNLNLVDFVIKVTMSLVCRHFKISETELIYGASSKDGIRINALSVYVQLIRENVYLSYSELREILHKKSQGAISKYVKIASSYDEKIPEHKEVLRKLSIIKAELKEQIDIYNSNSKK